VDGGCTLVGGFYPMLAAIDSAGWDLNAAPMRTDMTVTVGLEDAAAVVLFGQVQGGELAGTRARAKDVPYASLFVAPKHYLRTREVGDTTVRLLSRSRPPPVDDASDKILPYTLEPYAKYALDAAERAVELLDEVGVEHDRELTIVQAPLRADVAVSAQSGVVVLSDRWYRIWPAKRLRKFHDRQLARAIFGALLARHIAERGSESRRDVDVAAGVGAAYLTDLFTLRQYRVRETATDILQPVRFLPVIDQVLYAPQLMFADAYFGNTVEDESLREDPRRFNHTRPGGRLLYEKLRDLFGAAALNEAMTSLLVDGVPLRAAAEAAYGGSLGWFFRQWSRPYPRLNYRIGTLHTDQVATARYQHRLEIVRDTAAGDQPPIEPVEVAVVDARGNRHDLRWDGRGDRGVIEFETVAPVKVVSLDPNRRLAETRLPGDDNHALYDNRRPLRTRFVYNSLGVLVNLSDLTGILAADFSLGRVHDLRWRTRLTLFTSSATLVGGTATYSRFFGSQITADERLSTASVRLSAARLRANALADADPAASRIGLRLGLGTSNRIYVWEPRNSRGAGISLSATATRVDADAGADAQALLTGAASAGYTLLSTPWDGHSLLLNGGASTVFGDIEQRSQLLTGGGVGGSRGYGPFDLFGRVNLELHAEYRHVFVHDLDWNFGHYNFVRGIGGVLFADAVALSPETSHDLLDGRVYASVGYGLRFFYDSFGTLQQMMRIDLAVRVDGDITSAAPGVYLSFVPPF
jgi:hypothetical protein